MYTLSDYDYELPQKLIAQSAAHPADSCKFLVYDKRSDTTSDTIFHTFPQLTTPDSLIIFNTTKVVKARIPLQFGEKTGEIFYLESVTETSCNALVRPGKKFPVWSTIQITDGVTCNVDSISEEWRILTFSEPVLPLLQRLWQMPLPPYIGYDKSKESDYQTVFAQQPGSVAAPTASLHFTENVLQQLKERSVATSECILHVWLWTFKQVNVEDITSYDIHKESIEVTPKLFKDIANNKLWGKPVIWVWTTVTRTIESLPYLWKQLPDKEKTRCSQKTVQRRNDLITDIDETQASKFIAQREPTTTWRSVQTQLYIIPWFTFRIIDQLITNFHLPKSSLLMLVAAFVWYKKMRELYDHAITNSYRFYSFGDAMYLK